MDLLAEVEKQVITKRPDFNVGDVVEVHVRIIEGDKERIQVFSGTVISRSGSGARETFTVRRLVEGEGVERCFPLHSPRIADIRVRKKGEVRRAKLYYLRKRVGKATRIEGRVVEEAAATVKPAASSCETTRRSRQRLSRNFASQKARLRVGTVARWQPA